MGVLVLEGPDTNAVTDLAVRICRDTGAFYRRYKWGLSFDDQMDRLIADGQDKKLTVWDGSWLRPSWYTRGEIENLSDCLETQGMGVIVRPVVLDKSRCFFRTGPDNAGLYVPVPETWTTLAGPVTDAALSAIYLGLEAQNFLLA